MLLGNRSCLSWLLVLECLVTDVHTPLSVVGRKHDFSQFLETASFSMARKRIAVIRSHSEKKIDF